MTSAEISSLHTPSVAGLDVGDVVIARTFAISPHDALDYERSAFVHEGGAEGLRALQRLAPVSPGPGACQPALVLSRAVGAILDALGRGRRPLIVRSVGRLRCLATPVLGEALTPVVTVRFVTGQAQAEPHLTLDVQLRRRGGRVLATFELGVELSPAQPVVERESVLVA